LFNETSCGAIEPHKHFSDAEMVKLTALIATTTPGNGMRSLFRAVHPQKAKAATTAA